MATIKAMIVAVATAASLIMTSTQVDAAVINLTEGSTSGYTMTDGNTYVVQNSVTFSNTTAGGSGMSVADNATVVLYIPAGVTLTAKGANGSGQIGGGAGILVPETSVLVITGEGIINATGGNAGNGGNGANGSKGSSIECSYYNYPPYEGASTLVYGTAGKGSSGIGGAGGNGGGGAGAAIGGNGATGGSGGNGATSRAHLSYIHAGPKFCGNGNSGSYGCAGGNGIGMGACYVLGNVDIVVTGGTSGSAGKAGGFADWTYYFYNQHSAEEHFATCGGGGGGGGGAGKSPSCAIGGGGTSGGGGGGGGSGAIACRDNDCYNIYPLTNAHGGSGTGGMSNVSSGTTGASKEKTWGGTYANAIDYQTKPSYFYGGDGGTGGAAGAEGGVGTLYMSPTSTVNVDRETLSATTHPAAQYTITFDVNGGAYSSSAEALTATLGCELPDCIPTPMRRGYLFDGWQTATGEEYYGASGTKSKSDYPATEDIILYAQWYLDEDKLVVPGNTFWLRENAEAGWFVDSDVGDGEVLRSGEIGNSTNSWMETAIVGPASFSFDWKVSCNTRGHYLAWFVDGVEQARIRGVTDWATVAASIPEGEHVVRFDYVKGSTAAAGEDKGQVRNFSIDPVRIETETMQVMWDWTTNYFVSVSTTGFGTADFESGWIADGSNVVVTIAPYIHSYSIALLGDTDGAALDGTNLAFQVCGAARSLAVSIDEVKPRLVVASAHGTPTPAVGDHLYSSDAEVTVSVEAPAAVDGVRAVCTGWTGTGSVPASGDGSSATFVITEDSSITWNWATGYWVEFSIVGKGTTSYEAQWVADGTNLVIPFSVNTPFYSLSLSGDTEGAALGADSITVPITAPRSIVLNVTEYTYEAALDGRRLSWSSGGAAIWVPQAEVSHDGEDAAKSGEVTGDDVSTLSISVTGPGTLSWWWKLDMSDCAGVDVFVDEAFVESLDSVSDWVSASVNVVGDGKHAVRFEFWNAGTAAAISDCAYIDQVSWTPEGGVIDHTVTTPVPVPHEWLLQHMPNVADEDDALEAAATGMAANGRNTVWECYALGMEPTENFRITALPMKADGTPDLDALEFEPAQSKWNVPGARAKVLGKATLGGEWQVVPPGGNPDFRFFTVAVELP